MCIITNSISEFILYKYSAVKNKIASLSSVKNNNK